MADQVSAVAGLGRREPSVVVNSRFKSFDLHDRLCAMLRTDEACRLLKTSIYIINQ